MPALNAVRTALIAGVLCGLGAGCRSAPHVSQEASAFRIVSLAPAATEILFGLGLGSQVVGVTRFCDFPPEARSLPKVGGYADVDVEKVLALKPQYVVGQEFRGNVSALKWLERSGIEVVGISSGSLREIRRGVSAVGNRFGRSEAARTWEGLLDSELRMLDRGRIARSPRVAPRIVVLYGYRPWVVAGPESFAGELIEQGGGSLVAPRKAKDYAQVEREWFEHSEIDLILDAARWTEPGEEEIREGFQKSGLRIERSAEAFNRPGPRLLDVVADVRKVLDGFN